MAITAAGKIAPQGMVLVLPRQRLTLNQEIKHNLEFRQVFAPFAGEFDIPFELIGPAESPHMPKSA
jgi:hypothetical protein